MFDMHAQVPRRRSEGTFDLSNWLLLSWMVGQIIPLPALQCRARRLLMPQVSVECVDVSDGPDVSDGMDLMMILNVYIYVQYIY